jgi:hypothetical protein
LSRIAPAATKKAGHHSGQGRDRSVDLRFFRPALYRLSYLTGSSSDSCSLAGGDDGTRTRDLRLDRPA